MTHAACERMDLKTQLSSRKRDAFQRNSCLPANPDPYPIYAALLQESPARWYEGF